MSKIQILEEGNEEETGRDWLTHGSGIDRSGLYVAKRGDLQLDSFGVCRLPWTLLSHCIFASIEHMGVALPQARGVHDHPSAGSSIVS